MRKYLIPLILLILVLASYWQTVNLYFWVDDWDMFLKVVNPDLALWGMAPGPFGSGPYRYLHTPFYFLFPFFGLNATGYFVVGLLLYFLATLGVYFLITKIVGRSTGLFVGALFATIGYIGSYSLTHLSNYYQMIGLIIFNTSYLLALTAYFKSKKIYWYIVSILLFWATGEFLFIRAHGILILVLSFFALYYPWKKNLKTIMVGVVQLIPFVLIYNNVFAASYSSGSSTFGVFIHSLRSDYRNFAFFIDFPAVLTNILISDALTKPLHAWFTTYVSEQVLEIILGGLYVVILLALTRQKKDKRIYFFAGFLGLLVTLYFRWALQVPIVTVTDHERFIIYFGGYVLLLLLLFIYTLFWKNRKEALGLLFGLLWFVSQYLGYFAYSPSSTLLPSFHRYLTPSTVGAAIILGVLTSYVFLKRIRLGIFLVSIIVLVNMAVINNELDQIVKIISNPTKKLYTTIRSEFPSLPKDPVIYMDIENDPALKYQITSSFPGTAFALFYKLEDRAHLYFSFDEISELLKQDKAAIDHVVGMYVTKTKLQNTTQNIRDSLEQKSDWQEISSSAWHSNTPFSGKDNEFVTKTITHKQKDIAIGVNPSSEGEIGYKSSVPLLFEVTLSAAALPLESFYFPYLDITPSMSGAVTKDDLETFSPDSFVLPDECSHRDVLLQGERERKNFIQHAQFTTSSESGDNKTSNLVDGNFTTDWTAHALHFDQQNNEEIQIDLQDIQPVRRLIWINHFAKGSPTRYAVETSIDGNSWEKVTEVSDGQVRKDDEVVLDVFSDTKQARYIKMTITKTAKNFSPSIRELWVDSLSEQELNVSTNHMVLEHPLLCKAQNLAEIDDIYQKLDGNVMATFSWMKNSDPKYESENTVRFGLIPDGGDHTYSFYIPPSGTELTSVKIDSFQMPLEIRIKNARVRSFDLEELKTIQKEPQVY